ncbi:MAG: calcium-binding EGF-like domain-containing protein, partial [Myxococcota bacterium]
MQTKRLAFLVLCTLVMGCGQTTTTDDASGGDTALDTAQGAGGDTTDVGTSPPPDVDGTAIDDGEPSPPPDGAAGADASDAPPAPCDPGFFGPGCAPCPGDGAPCSMHGTCDDGLTGTGECTCEPGWAGPGCAEDIDECADAPCQNGGTCTDGVASFTCACAPGYEGETCEVDIDDCA